MSSKKRKQILEEKKQRRLEMLESNPFRESKYATKARAKRLAKKLEHGSN